jgi:hypothetical protein
VPSGDEISK